jgi:hypothetical protein
MLKIQTIVAIVGLLFSLTASAENKQINKIEPLPRDLEIQLALSALPPHLPRSQLAVLPGTTHVTLVDRGDWLASMITAILDAPMP